MENERYLFSTSDDNVSKIIDFIWPVYKEIFGIEKIYGKQCIIYNDAESKHADTELGTDSVKIKLALKEPCMWNDMIFQLAYEMCYCILREYKRQWKKERYLSWYEETVCNAFSRYILKYSVENWNKCDLSNINPEYSKYIDEYLQMKIKEEGTKQQENINKLYDIFCENPKAINSLGKYYDYINKDNSSIDVQCWSKDIGISIPETLSRNGSVEETLPQYIYEICKKYWNEKFPQFSACVAVIFSMALWIIKGIWYTYMAGKFSVYKIDKCYIDMNNDSVFLQTIQLIAYLTIGIFSNYAFYKILKTKKKKVRNIIIFVAIEEVILFLFVFVSNGFTLEQVCSQLTIRLVVTALILYIIVVVLINSFAINVVHSEHKKEKIIRTQKQNISRKNQIKELIFAITITLAAGFGYTYWIAETTEQRREDYKILELTNTDDEDMMYAVVYETQDSYIVVEMQIENGKLSLNRNNQRIIDKEGQATYYINNIYGANVSEQ